MLNTTRYAPFAVVLAFVLLASAAEAEAERMFEGRVDGNLTGEPIWVGLFVGDATAGSWTRVDGGHFEVAVPVDERSSLVIISKDRVAKKILVVGERMAMRLQPGQALAGTVHSEDGSPLSDVTITVEARYGGLEVPPFATPRWRTDRAGAFVIEGLDSGSHTLAFARDGIPVLLQEVSIPSDVERQRVDVALGAGHFISGRVVDSVGEPVADATVETEWWIVARTKTAEDGSFRLGPFRKSTPARLRANLPEVGVSLPHEVDAPSEGLVLELRRYMLLGQVVRARTGEPVPSFRLMILAEGVRKWSTVDTEDGFFQVPLKDPLYAVAISAEGHPPWFSTLAPGESDNYDLGLVALPPERSISGRVVDALTGTPIEGANVRLGSREHDDSYWRSVTSQLGGAETDADGGFALSALPREEAPVATLAPGYQRKTVYLPPQVRHLDIALDPDVPGATISGSLTLPDGTPVAGIVAVASPNSEYRPPYNYNEQTTTGANGAFRLAGLQDGAYDLVAASEAGVVQSRAVVVADGASLQDVRLVVEDGPRVQLSLAGLRSEASVSIYDQNQRKIYEWEFGNGTHAIRGLPGEWTVKAIASVGSGSVRLTERLRLQEGQEAAITFDFAHDSRLSGTVTTGGRPLGDIYLKVVPADPSMPAGRTLTTRHGRYDVWGLSKGRHVVRTLAGHSFEVDVAEQTSLDIELPPISVSGAVRSVRRPISRALVQLHGSNGYRRSALTAVDGTFHFHGLSAGEYVVDASGRGFESLSRRLLVGGEESVTLELDQSASGEDSAGRD